jgi:SpoVK/Ycf46/Vps4 family AAA+-type ATPase
LFTVTQVLFLTLLAWPTVGGFSFTIKKWGEIALENVSDIVFDDNTFSRLVLNPEKKELIRALVVHTENAFADIISGKGAGCIFLLHGKPGCGKTLTAEAIAEMLHRPLYSVSVGELGTKTETLETKLRDILEVASVWNAVILIDEADIFLEKRADSDIERNAMVGIFLR